VSRAHGRHVEVLLPESGLTLGDSFSNGPAEVWAYEASRQYSGELCLRMQFSAEILNDRQAEKHGFNLGLVF
jgi:hypothetical protein